MTDCVFCDIVAGRAPANIVREWSRAIAFTPRNPVTDGHTLVIPRQHVRDAADYPTLTAHTMRCAAGLVREFGDANLITSIGSVATQTIFHLHIHVVPRRDGDGLLLPWSRSVV